MSGYQFFPLSQETWDWLFQGSNRAVNRAVPIREVIEERDPGPVEDAPDGVGGDV